MTSTRLILLVEDDGLNAEVLALAAIQEETPYRVRHACDGQEALQLAQESVPDLFVLNVELSGMDGGEVYDRLHAPSGLEAVPVLFLTATQHESLLAPIQDRSK